MSALARWLVRWQPIQLHRAILAGTGLEEVAAALGGGIDDAFGLWIPVGGLAARIGHLR